MLFTKLVVAVSGYLVREELSSSGDVAQIMATDASSCSEVCAATSTGKCIGRHEVLDVDVMKGIISNRRDDAAVTKANREKELTAFCGSECVVRNHKCVAKEDPKEDPSRKCGECCNGGDAFGSLSGTPRDMCNEQDCPHCSLTEYKDGRYTCTLSAESVPKSYAGVEALYPLGPDVEWHEMPEYIPQACFDAFYFEGRQATVATRTAQDCKKQGDGYRWCETLDVPQCLSKVSGIECPGGKKYAIDLPDTDTECCCKEGPCRADKKYTQTNEAPEGTFNCCRYRLHTCDASTYGQKGRRMGHRVMKLFGRNVFASAGQLGGYQTTAPDYTMCGDIKKLEVIVHELKEDEDAEDDSEEKDGVRAPRDLRGT